MALQDAHSSKLIVWEGEWPWVKEQVRGLRQSLSCFSGGKAESTAKSIAQTSSVALTSVDSALTTFSQGVSSFLKEEPWTIPAVGRGAFSGLVTVKSLRWGLPRATRNGLAAGLIGVTVLYPPDVRRLVFELNPPTVAELRKRWS
jgi:hypothetical protein